jgi:hypothetical protein
MVRGWRRRKRRRSDCPRGETLSVRPIRPRFSASMAANPAGDACPSRRPGGAVASRFVYARSPRFNPVKRNDEPTVVLEADKPSVKEVVDTRGQEQAVLTIQSLLV